MWAMLMRAVIISAVHNLDVVVFAARAGYMPDPAIETIVAAGGCTIMAPSYENHPTTGENQQAYSHGRP
jgi:hypothetical protein